jgi:hypothetical protein
MTKLEINKTSEQLEKKLLYWLANWVLWFHSGEDNKLELAEILSEIAKTKEREEREYYDV